MSILRSIFGPSKKEIWSGISQQIGGEFIEGGFWEKDKLLFKHGEWEILLDTYTVSNGKSSSTYTRMRAPFFNKDGLYFKIYREGIFSSIGKFFGMQDIQIGDPFFDKHFVIKGNNEEKIKLFLSSKLKVLIQSQPRILFEVKKNEGLFSEKFLENVNELYFQVHGVVKDRNILKLLFELFSAALENLVEIDSAYESSPEISK